MTDSRAHLPTKMRAVQATDFSLNGLSITELPVPVPRHDEILIRVKAVSLNYRDLAILSGSYIKDLIPPFVPASDACGEVVALGAAVTRFRIGDRVTPIYTQGWSQRRHTDEQRTMRERGGLVDGVLKEYISVRAEDALHAPEHLSDPEASTLPIAALTAWSALSESGVKPGQVVLLQGTGGVSLFALQFAKVWGARVIVLSSTQEKLDRVALLGADFGINYRENPDWHDAVLNITNGDGADVILETAGSTLSTSLSAIASGGFIGVVGFVAGYEASFQLRKLIVPGVRLQGIVIGPRSQFEEMNRCIVQHRLHPIVDQAFFLDDAGEAFRRMEAGSHFGKIVIKL
jgi:NADPH:quinone reductase-like Zn-dependent oxidoreductase